ncbi:hypothetical protein Ahy_B06g080737 isoform A [Arachis hypogaea]|uniref:Uncharacterized protein n=1 Tax=Arachis hypogaea TaxID=3818 RepID=A0A444YIV2_ARAHY|nr:hypothetical protein Ahy_B06g080737 isoform A [Arachis hypogaea]
MGASGTFSESVCFLSESSQRLSKRQRWRKKNIPTEYLGEYESNPDEDYDQEDEGAFSFIHIEDEPGFFPRPTERQMSHLRPLHVIAILNGFKINKVLINGGAAISLLPERMLEKVGKHPYDLVPTNIATWVSNRLVGTVSLEDFEDCTMSQGDGVPDYLFLENKYDSSDEVESDRPEVWLGWLDFGVWWKLLVVLFQKQVTAPIIQGCVVSEKWKSLSSLWIPKAFQSALLVGSRRRYQTVKSYPRGLIFGLFLKDF